MSDVTEVTEGVAEDAITTPVLPDWLTEAEKDMESQDSDFKDIEKGAYVFALTGYSGMKLDTSGNLGCQVELTIVDDEKFGGRKIWSWAVLEGQWANILTNKLIVAWIKRNPGLVAALGERPTDQPSWEAYLNAVEAGQLTAIATIKAKVKTQVEIDAGYNTKYDIYVAADQTQDE